MGDTVEGGQDGIPQIRRQNSALRRDSIYLTAYSERDTLDRARHTDSDGFLLKTQSANQLRLGRFCR